MSLGTISARSDSASRSTSPATTTAFEPFFLAIAIVTADWLGDCPDAGRETSAPPLSPRTVPGKNSCSVNPRAGPQPWRT